MQEIGEAFKQVGPVTRQAGMSIEETSGVLMALADAGIRGSAAGNNLKRILDRIVGQRGEVKRELQGLGINIEDQRTGELRPIADIIDELNAKMANMTAVQQQRHIGAIGGLYARSALGELLSVGGDAIRRNTSLFSQRGVAERNAIDRMNNLAGAWERFIGSIQGVQIALGRAFAPHRIVDGVRGSPRTRSRSRHELDPQ